MLELLGGRGIAGDRPRLQAAVAGRAESDLDVPAVTWR
jgi:hypothetical protein